MKCALIALHKSQLSAFQSLTTTTRFPFPKTQTVTLRCIHTHVTAAHHFTFTPPPSTQIHQAGIKMSALINNNTALLYILLLVLLSQVGPNSAEFSVGDALEWSSQYDEFGDGGLRSGLEHEEAEDGYGYGEEEIRRSLFWRAARYYISYGALAANRVPCPPRSGRSYYTHNCFRARGPVRPYVRGCSAITRCRR